MPNYLIKRGKAIPLNENIDLAKELIEAKWLNEVLVIHTEEKDKAIFPNETKTDWNRG